MNSASSNLECGCPDAEAGTENSEFEVEVLVTQPDNGSGCNFGVIPGPFGLEYVKVVSMHLPLGTLMLQYCCQKYCNGSVLWAFCLLLVTRDDSENCLNSDSSSEMMVFPMILRPDEG